MRARTLVLFVFLLLLSTGTTGCQRAAMETAVALPFANACSIKPNNPHQSSGTPSDIVGKAEMGCDVAVDELRFTVRLQQQTSGGTWETIDLATGSLYGVQTVASVKRPIIRQVVGACSPGAFRTSGQVTVRYEGKVLTGKTGFSQTVLNPCAGGGGGHGSW